MFRAVRTLSPWQTAGQSIFGQRGGPFAAKNARTPAASDRPAFAGSASMPGMTSLHFGGADQPFSADRFTTPAAHFFLVIAHGRYSRRRQISRASCRFGVDIPTPARTQSRTRNETRSLPGPMENAVRLSRWGSARSPPTPPRSWTLVHHRPPGRVPNRSPIMESPGDECGQFGFVSWPSDRPGAAE